MVKGGPGGKGGALAPGGKGKGGPSKGGALAPGVPLSLPPPKAPPPPLVRGDKGKNHARPKPDPNADPVLDQIARDEAAEQRKQEQESVPKFSLTIF